MPKQWTAIEVQGTNHDWDFQVDDQGQITGLLIKGSVAYDNGDETMVRTESFNVWAVMNQTQKDKLQAAYTAAKNAFDNHFLGS